MTDLEIGSATRSHSFQWNEITNPKRQEARVALISTSIDEQMTLPDEYGYLTMDAKETIAAFEVNQQNINRLVPEVSDRVAKAKIAWDRLTPWLCKKSDCGDFFNRRFHTPRAESSLWKAYGERRRR